MKIKNYKSLKDYAKKTGVLLFGVADTRELKKQFIFEDKDILKDLNYGVSIGVPLLSAVLETLVDSPNLLYFHHYRQTNNLLDKISLQVSHFIQDKGCNAIPIPASQIIDWKNQTAQVSHKAVAVQAGLGWIGRNNLLVNPVYGSKARYATILTDFPLKADKPYKRGDCGDCYKCLSFCPANAIAKNPKDFNHLACFEKLKEFARIPGIGQFICGLCVKACDGKEHRAKGMDKKSHQCTSHQCESMVHGAEGIERKIVGR